MNSAAILALFAFTLASVSAQSTTNKKDSNICKRDNGFFPHEQYCDYYYECFDGVPYLHECPNGLAFSGAGRGMLEKCDYPHRVGCPDPDGTRVMGQPPRGSGNCPYLYGINPHEKSCTRYWLCWNGTGTVQMCPFSLLYNEQEHACDWPEKVPGCQQHPLCTTEPNGVKAIQGSCSRYWLCLGGYPRIQQCPAGLAFSQVTLRCDWESNVPGCEPEPVPEEEEEALQKPAARRQQQSRSRASTSDEESTQN